MYIHTYIYVNVYMCIYIYIYIYNYTHLYIYIRIIIYNYIHTYTPYFGHLHVSVQNMPWKILIKEAPCHKFASDESLRSILWITHSSNVWSSWLVWSGLTGNFSLKKQIDHVKRPQPEYDVPFLRYWWFNDGMVQPRKNLTWVAIPRLRAPSCAWKNRRSPSWTSDLTWHLEWMHLLMLLWLKIAYVQ